MFDIVTLLKPSEKKENLMSYITMGHMTLKSSPVFVIPFIIWLSLSVIYKNTAGSICIFNVVEIFAGMNWNNFRMMWGMIIYGQDMKWVNFWDVSK